MPNRAARRPGEPGEALSRIVLVAVGIADAEGLQGVSIRRIAGELQMRPMSLYTYIASKDELLELMAEHVVGEVLIRHPLPGDWRAAITLIATRSHEVFTAHPWILAISQRRATLGRNGLRHAEQQLSAIAPLNLPPTEEWKILFLINDLALGHALRVAHAAAAPPNAYPDFDAADYPHLARALTAPAPARSAASFRAALDLLLDAVEARHRPPE